MIRRPHLKIRLSMVIIAIDAITYAILAALSNNPLHISSRLLSIVGQANFMVLYRGYWWQLITAMFVHITLPHLILNLLYLYLIGVPFERLYGHKNFLITFLLSGIFGNVLSLAMGPYVITAGASGALFGLIGAMTVIERGKHGGRFRDALTALLILVLLNSMWQGVNILAHLGGLVVGVILGLRYSRHYSIGRYAYWYYTTRR